MDILNLNKILNSNLKYRKYDRRNREMNHGNNYTEQKVHNVLMPGIKTKALPSFPNTDNRQVTNNIGWEQDDTYRAILNSIALFRKTDKWGEISPYKLFDTPSHFYFKIFFYFGEDNLLSTEYDTSLFPVNLYTTTTTPEGEQSETPENTSNSLVKSTNEWRLPDTITTNNYPQQPREVSEGTKTKYMSSMAQGGFIGKNSKGHSANSAFNYLLINQEYQRAEKLLKFIKLLQDISVECPWYFRAVTGIETALERKEFDKDFKVEEERKSLTIKCLADAFDTRIGTLLDLYRDIVVSYEMHKEIVPANLRKFDMGIYIFEAPNSILHKNTFETWRNNGVSDNDMKYMKLNEGNTKYIEFHNCEIDYNSSKSFDEINNEEGYSPEYTITIKYDTAYEERYNNTLNMIIGDFYKWDIEYNDSNNDNAGYRSDNLTGNTDQFDFKTMSLDIKELENARASNIFDEIKRIVPGNLYKRDYEETIGQMLSKQIAVKLNEGRDKLTGYMNDKVISPMVTPIDNARSYVKTKSGEIYQKYRNKVNEGWNFGRLWEN